MTHHRGGDSSAVSRTDTASGGAAPDRAGSLAACAWLPHRPFRARRPQYFPAVALTRLSELHVEVWPADFNRDGITDLVAGTPRPFPAPKAETCWSSSGGVTACSARAVLPSPWTIMRPLGVGDFNGDGKIDIIACAIAGMDDVNVYIIPGNGDGTFGSGTSLSRTSMARASHVSADLNADGRRDLVLARMSPAAVRNRVNLYRGHGDFTFNPPVSVPAADRSTTASSPT